MKQSIKPLFSTKDCAYVSIFVAVVIVVQLAFSSLPGIELVTLLFVTYSFVFGITRGVISATAFSLLRQILFGFFPTVLVLYLVYYNFLVFIFGILGKHIKSPLKALWLIVIIACICTACFTMLDNFITPVWYGYSEKARQAYFKASLAFMLPQIFCTAVSVGGLFIPLNKIFKMIK